MTNLVDLAKKLFDDGPVRAAPASGRRVRVLFGSSFIIDSTEGQHVWEHPYYPQYYFPYFNLKASPDSKETIYVNDKGVAQVLHLKQKDRMGTVLHLFDIAEWKGLRGLVRPTFGEMDQWFEEDTKIYVHPKDPTKRIDILPSTRTVEIQVNGKTLAKSSSSMHLIEPLLPVRYYLPQTAVTDQSLLRASDTRSLCPYKGEAEYYDIVLDDGSVHKDLAWWYRYPTPESHAITGLLCFYNEKVDVILDGKKLKRPKTKFS
ncbi:DUF427-domain-containing protein [Patellaria atrata CBS 101060]|uniref:DUF427-domain-containing protein n=1 Tax=Patellaria atrata CBS 101060 TaxID=1346257 RepID=A0A9P4SEH4_9PEZI|nr:DUF427-domain-containing protein [Patellaria atrata CBS 101060]